MIQSLFLYLALPLLLTFWLMAAFYRKLGIYIVGMIMTNLYFLFGSELIVHFYSKKLGIGLIGFDEILKLIFNPYTKGGYSFFVLNFSHNKFYFITLWLLSLIGLLALLKRIIKSS